METLLVRLKAFDPRRGHVLRRYTYAGIKFHEERGWYRVARDVGAYLRTVHESAEAEYSPLAFDVCTEEEARALDTREETESKVRRAAVDDLKVSVARPDAVVTVDVAEPRTSTGAQGPSTAPPGSPKPDDPKARREK
jgi:hypothetical protein